LAGTYTWTALYGGDGNNNPADDQGGAAEQTVVNSASPTIVTTTSPTEVELPITAPVVVTDIADLEGGYYPTGSIVFTLTGPGGFSQTRTDPVSGNGTYTASITLPTTGTVAGTYTWTAHYGGDGNNNAASDQGGFAEQTVVSPASPTLTTISDPSTALKGVTLQDSADLTGGFDPTGSIIFSLYAPGVNPTIGPLTYTENVGVNGNGTYHTTVGFVSNSAGIWHWVATYGGDLNNNSVSSGPMDEPVTLHPFADLAVTKTVDNPTPIFGRPITYSITVTNHGPDTATNVVVADPLPPGLVLIAAAPSQGAVSGAVVWNVGTLANGTTAILHVTALTAAEGPIVNNAAAGADQFDPDLANNDATAMVTVRQNSKVDLLGSTVLHGFGVDPATFPLNAQFVAHVYRDLLHRDPDPLGLAAWSNFLDNGGSRTQLVLGFESSPEYLGDQVDAVYALLLHRSADPGGRSAFLSFLESGGTFEQMEALIAGSPEYFQKRGGGTNDGFLNALYMDGLGRAVDAAGRAAWDQALANGSSRTQVAAGIFSSPEYANDLVNNYYTTYLRRQADPAGLNAWVGQLLAGVKDQRVLADILGSAEYFMRVA
jgi:uncharacterized repeat protein (TIGR01451 family)